MDKVLTAEMNCFHDTDAALIAAINGNDTKAFRQLYERYQEDMYRLALRKIQSEEIAEEIVQEVFVGLWEKRHRLVISDIRSYLFRSVKNGVLDHIRAQIVRQNYANEYAFEIEPSYNNTDDILALYELTAAIHSGMDSLSEKTREIFRFNRLEALSAEEISKILDLPKRTVEYHITLALRVMRTSLKDYLPFWLLLILRS